MEYLIVGLAIILLLALKCFLMKRNFQNSSQRFMNPKSFADQLLESQRKKIGIQKVRQELNPSNMISIVRQNVEYLKGSLPTKNQKISIQKLRNICLCSQLLDNPQLNKEDKPKQQVKRLNGELLKEWDSWLSANKNSPGLAGQMSKYLLYLSKHFT